ncbi:hypothetical protein ACFLTQ_01500 [Chloroflexota bacterium]
MSYHCIQYNLKKGVEMLIAAMILGLMGGVLYFIAGSGLATVGEDTQLFNGDSAPWWVISMIPIGIVGIIGGALVLWKPNSLVFQRLPLSAVLLLLASVAAFAIGIVSYEEAVEDMFASVLLGIPMHLFSGNLISSPGPLLALIIAAALNIAGRKRQVQES